MNLVFEPLTEHHPVEGFRSGGTYLDHYLQNEALEAQASDLARSFVAIDTEGDLAQIVGYFTLKFSPQYVPQLTDGWVALGEIVSLARDERWRGLGVGSALLLEALSYFAEAAQYAAFPGVFLYATEEGSTLYEAWEFKRVAPDRRAYFISLSELKAIVASMERL